MEPVSRSSMEKRPAVLAVVDEQTPQPAFARLPDEIIEQILHLTDPESFASLLLLNPDWRRVAQQAHLYAYHLARCPSYSASHSAVPPALVDHDSLPQLRKLFAREIKRNLFEAYLRPKKTTIKLVSNSISSSSVPGGEGMQFSPSPRGHHLLAYNSSRIYVLDVRGPDLDVKRELKILRRPASTCILDDGSVLAVLSSDMQVDLYDLRAHPPRRTQSLILDHAPRTIALSPCGSVLAAAYEGGIEVQSLNPGALPTERRAVKCDGVDSLAFSFDGTQLLGTTTVAQPPNTVILTAPYYDPGSSMGEHDISALWTTSILFPNTSRDCSHAVLLQESSSEEASWTFTYDRSFETFRAVRIDDLRNGTTYFTGPVPNAHSQAPLLPCTLPAATSCGDLVSAGFEGRDIWVYGIPEDLEAVPDNAASSENAPPPDRRNSTLSGRSSSRVPETNGGRVPQWQLLCDKYRNSFVSGYKATALDGVSTVKWVAGHGSTSLQERLVVAARGVLPPKPITEEDDFDFVDGGKITILDFDYGVENGDEKEITIEVGTKEPEALEEEHRDIDTEVAIVRRRTVAQRRGGGRTGLMRSATTAPTEADTLLLPPIPAVDQEDDEEDPLTPRRMLGPRTPVIASPGLRGEPEDATLEEAQEALDAPYAHASPRSGPTLRRAATAAAVNRRLHPSSATNGRIEYRRADGRAEHPHESDADNWVPPPPPYSREDPGDTPAFLRAPAIPGVGLDIIRDEQGNSLAMAPAAAQAQTRRSPPPPLASPQPSPPLVPSVSSGAASRPNLPRLQTSSVHSSQGSYHRVVSSPTHQSSVFDATSERRPMSSPVGTGEFSPRSPDDEVAYDVSPVESPPPQDIALANRQHQIPCYGLPHASPSAPMLETSSSTITMAPASSTSRTTDLLNSYVLNLDIPSPSLALNMDRDQHETSPVMGKLPNSQTWPRAPVASEQTPTAEPSGYPRSAPPINNINTDRFETALPPFPRPDQLANSPNRHDQSIPRPTSGSFQIPRVPVPYSSHGRSNSRSLVQAYHQSPTVSEPDQPLIISTPTGVSGAFDDPGRQLSSRGTTASAPVLMSPVPRHPLSTPGALRSSSDRLDTLIGPNGQVFSVPPPPPSSQLTASLRHHTSLSRRQSRAKRSAAKNVKDAHQRGWAGRRIRRQTEGGADGAASSAAWTDVASTSGATADKEPKSTRGGKCAVM